MNRIAATNLSLIHPITTSARTSSGLQDTQTAKLIRNRQGRVVGVRALAGVTFDFREGSRVGVIGHNGSGKTTLLRVLAGILPPDDGQLITEGHPTNLININLGMKNDATGHRNITLQGLAAGRSRREIEAHRDEIAAFSDLGEFLNFPVHTYSAGMRMRLSFAVATAFEPEILLLDEWLSAGDQQFRDKASQRMKDYVEQAGILVMASHSHALLEQNCSTIIWLRDGNVEDLGPAEPILRRYFSSNRSA